MSLQQPPTFPKLSPFQLHQYHLLPWQNQWLLEPNDASLLTQYSLTNQARNYLSIRQLHSKTLPSSINSWKSQPHLPPPPRTMQLQFLLLHWYHPIHANRTFQISVPLPSNSGNFLKSILNVPRFSLQPPTEQPSPTIPCPPHGLAYPCLQGGHPLRHHQNSLQSHHSWLYQNHHHCCRPQWPMQSQWHQLPQCTNPTQLRHFQTAFSFILYLSHSPI